MLRGLALEEEYSRYFYSNEVPTHSCINNKRKDHCGKQLVCQMMR